MSENPYLMKECANKALALNLGLDELYDDDLPIKKEMDEFIRACRIDKQEADHLMKLADHMLHLEDKFYAKSEIFSTALKQIRDNPW